MKHIVQFSGGAASAYVAYLVSKEFGKENTVLLFHDTLAEHPDATRFRKQVADFLGMEITEVSDGRSLWQVIADHHSLPSQFIPFCTDELKLKQAEKYIKSINDDFILYNGLGPEEWRRIQRSIARSESLGRKIRCPLNELKLSNTEVKRIIREDWKICLPEPYKYLEHNNCIPCFKAGKSHFYRVWKYYPEQFEMACNAEEMIGYTVFKDSPTLRELAKTWSNQTSLFDNDDLEIPCMCAI